MDKSHRHIRHIKLRITLIHFLLINGFHLLTCWLLKSFNPKDLIQGPPGSRSQWVITFSINPNSLNFQDPLQVCCFPWIACRTSCPRPLTSSRPRPTPSAVSRSRTWCKGASKNSTWSSSGPSLSRASGSCVLRTRWRSSRPPSWILTSYDWLIGKGPFRGGIYSRRKNCCGDC